jgi:CheY-like chemotaxis protein
MAISNYLESFHIKYEEGYNGAQAIEMVEKAIITKNHVDFILMDNEMPGITGLNAAIHIKNLLIKENMSCIPIILISGDPIDNDEEKGITCALQKPVSKSNLSNAISSLNIC